MKTNHIPVQDRLRRRIANLRAKIRHGDHWTSKRFYPECIYCGITNVNVSITGEHYKGCLVTGVLNEIAHYERLLKQVEDTA